MRKNDAIGTKLWKTELIKQGFSLKYDFRLVVERYSILTESRNGRSMEERKKGRPLEFSQEIHYLVAQLARPFVAPVERNQFAVLGVLEGRATIISVERISSRNEEAIFDDLQELWQRIPGPSRSIPLHFLQGEGESVSCTARTNEAQLALLSQGRYLSSLRPARESQNKMPFPLKEGHLHLPQWPSQSSAISCYYFMTRNGTPDTGGEFPFTRNPQSRYGWPL